MIQNIKGTRDILPDEVVQWQRIEAIIRRVTRTFDYKEIRTPVIEYTELFQKSAGEGSDVVSKEMYSFNDRSQEQICLRPELTAPVARVVAQNTLLRANPTLRLWYSGPCFRYERPQLGRQRQFHQVGAECIGSTHPESDAEIITLGYNLITQCGIQDFELHINSLGSVDSRKNYRDALVSYLKQFEPQLSEDSQRRLGTNPLRILDSKDEADKAIVASAPKLVDCLDESSMQHFRDVQALLQAAGIPFVINPVLVRGLDYYTHTVFEFKTNSLGAQDAIGGGGRYDNLFETIKAQPASGVGFGIGLERLILLASKQNENAVEDLDCFLVADAKYLATALEYAQLIRNNGFSCRTDLQRRSFKAQMKEADKFGARKVLILAESEIADKSFTVKDMKTGTQESIIYSPEALLRSLSH